MPGVSMAGGLSPGYFAAHGLFHARPIHLFQRHPCGGGRGRRRNRRCHHPALHRDLTIPAARSIRRWSRSGRWRCGAWSGQRTVRTDGLRRRRPTGDHVNFGDYSSADRDRSAAFESLYKESPSPHNPLGVKGVGEVGVIPAAAAIISAIEHALSPFHRAHRTNAGHATKTRRTDRAGCDTVGF